MNSEVGRELDVELGKRNGSDNSENSTAVVRWGKAPFVAEGRIEAQQQG